MYNADKYALIQEANLCSKVFQKLIILGIKFAFKHELSGIMSSVAKLFGVMATI